MVDWICPNCNREIHALDGSISSNGEPFRHFDCESATRIDYASAFDRMHEAMCDLGELTHRLMEHTTEGWEDRDPAIEEIIAALWVKPGEALDHHWLTTGERREVTSREIKPTAEENR